MTLNTVPALSAGISSRNKYLDILDSAWQQHLAPRADNAPTVISTFAGAGGSSLGYSMAGYRELLAVEWDNNAVETFRLNFPDVPAYHGDIAKLSVEQCLEMASIQAGQLDVFDGSPPCQGFSTAGKRVMDDPRNQLFREYVRLLRGLQPKVFVMENVSGMVKGKMKLIFVDILRELKASGYQVSARLMNAMYFNVPQSRQRMIFIGVRDDLATAPSHPKAESRPFTVRDAWQGLDIPTDDLDYAIKIVEHRKSSIGVWLAKTPQGGQLSDLEPRGFFFNWVRLAFNRVSPSVPKEDTNLCHPTEFRALTFTECQRLATYPDRFKFAGSPHQNRARIGNSVPPLFMRAIAAHIRTHILSGLEPRRVSE
jgi:DNA (cytosine-5)-methyltransferase 1